MSMSETEFVLSVSTMSLFFIFTFLSVAIADDAVYMSLLVKSLTPTPPGWSQNTSFCHWNGVACDQSFRVTAIVLPSSSLSGTLPSDLNSSLSHLTHLNLHNNSLSGSLPSLTNLASLKTVYLSHNNFTFVPNRCFQGLTNLHTLNLSHNLNLEPSTFPTELTQSSSLDTLHLHATNITGSLPDGIFDSFPSLRSVDLSYNRITGVLPVSLGRSAIRYLRLDNQNGGFGLAGTIDVISSMKFLSQVWLQGNEFTGPIPDMSNCTSLFDLQLQDNDLSGVVPPSLMGLPSLENVSLNGNWLQGPVPLFRKGVKGTWESENNFCRKDIGPCDPQVTVLLEIAAAFGYPLVLSTSWKGNNPCTWNFIECEEQQPGGGKIVAVDLQNRHFSGTISPAFSNLTGLLRLNLNGNYLKGPIPESLTTLSKLELLVLSNNNLCGQVPKFPPRVKLYTAGNALLGHSPCGALSGSPSETLNTVLITGASVVSAGVLIFIMVICKRKRYHHSFLQQSIFKKTRTFDDKSNVEDFLKSYDLLVPKRYSYAEVKRITNSFRDKLGQGGYGAVYKASLPDGRRVAVKMINESNGNGEEFINEVASISRTSHMNIVSLLGFCYEMNKRALLYEFMPNGSLDKFIYTSGFPNAICNMDWSMLYQISIGIARGLEYLHQGCNSRILHLDIKPQNILLDEDLCPKISDFGLAKVCQKKDSIVSMVGTRGTIGYIAPEVFSRTFGGVSHKSDVYSYGMLILEMIGGRKNHDRSYTSEMYFPDWIYKDLEQGNDLAKLLAISEEENDMVRKITLVSLWCIQTNPSNRPSMTKVIEMLEGTLQSIPYPPKPILYSPEMSPS